MCYIHQYIANVCYNSLIHSVFEITFNKPMKSTIEKHVFSGVKSLKSSPRVVAL